MTSWLSSTVRGLKQWQFGCQWHDNPPPIWTCDCMGLSSAISSIPMHSQPTLPDYRACKRLTLRNNVRLSLATLKISSGLPGTTHTSELGRARRRSCTVYVEEAAVRLTLDFGILPKWLVSGWRIPLANPLGKDFGCPKWLVLGWRTPLANPLGKDFGIQNG